MSIPGPVPVSVFFSGNGRFPAISVVEDGDPVLFAGSTSGDETAASEFSSECGRLLSVEGAGFPLSLHDHRMTSKVITARFIVFIVMEFQLKMHHKDKFHKKLVISQCKDSGRYD